MNSISHQRARPKSADYIVAILTTYMNWTTDVSELGWVIDDYEL